MTMHPPGGLRAVYWGGATWLRIAASTRAIRSRLTPRARLLARDRVQLRTERDEPDVERVDDPKGKVELHGRRAEVSGRLPRCQLVVCNASSGTSPRKPSLSTCSAVSIGSWDALMSRAKRPNAPNACRSKRRRPPESASLASTRTDISPAEEETATAHDELCRTLESFNKLDVPDQEAIACAELGRICTQGIDQMKPRLNFAALSIPMPDRPARTTTPGSANGCRTWSTARV